MAGIAGALGFEKIGKAAARLDKKLQEPPDEMALEDYHAEISMLIYSYAKLCRAEVTVNDKE